MIVNTPSADFLHRTPVHVETNQIDSLDISVLDLPDMTPEMLVVDPLPRAFTIPSTWYTDPRYHEADQ
jgi:hypothetical protein